MPSFVLYSIDEVRMELGLSRSTIYRLIAAGEIEQVEIGGRSKVTRDSVGDYIRRQRMLARASKATR